MRADRVLSLLLLLQARGRMSAADLADRLEVSRRTVYRDVDALGAAGVPVTAEPGPHGGIGLMDGWRTDLTGLTEPELEALFSSSTGPAFDRAMGKLAASLPGESGLKAARMRERLLIDSAAWGRRGEISAHLRVVQDAVIDDRRLRLSYRRAEAELVVRLVDPLGLILKAGTWYLIGDVDGARRLFRLSRIESAEILAEPCRRPPGFDLAAAWREQTEGWDGGRAAYQALVRASDLPLLIRMAGDRLIDRPGPDLARLAFPGLEPAAAFIASFGGLLEVIEPLPLRDELARRGAQLVRLYS